MKNRIIARVIVAAVFAILFGMFMYADYHRWHVHGKDAFLTHEASRFDKYMAHPSIFMGFGGALVACFVIAVYEVFTFTTFKILSFFRKPKES